jgi:Tfp pilus assembly protein PilF
MALSAPKVASDAPRPPLADANEALEQGKVTEACALGEQALASSGASPGVYKFLGQCFMRLGERERAVAYYQRYLEMSPTSSDAVFIREMIK